MLRIYSATQSAQAITTAVDLWHVTVAAEKPCVFLGMELFQTTDVGDAAEEIIGIGVYRGVTGGGGGTAITEVALDSQDGTTPGTAVVGQGTASTSGTLVTIIPWNVRVAGPIWLPIPELRIRCSAAEDPVAFRLMAAPVDSITVSSTLYFAEGQ